MKYECKTHGIWDTHTESGCPECVREMRKENGNMKSLLNRIYDNYNQTSNMSTEHLKEIGFMLGSMEKSNRV